MIRTILIAIGMLLLCASAASAAPAVPAIAGAIAGALGLGTIGTAIAGLALSVGISYAINRAFAPSRPQFSPGSYQDPGVKQRLPSNTANKLPVLYGVNRARGTIIHAAISSDNQRMAFILALCEGPVESIGSPRWDDTTIRLTGQSGYDYQQTENATGASSDLLNATHTRGNFGGGDEETNFLTDNIRFAFYPKGSARCTYMEDFDSTGWGDSSRGSRTMPDVAYVYIELDYDRDAGVTGLAQDLSFEVQGKLVRDFDTDGLTSAAASYSDNPARCTLDYMMNTRYGAELAESDIDFESMNAWKQFCDETNIPHAPDSEAKRYTANGAVNTNDQRDTILSDLFFSASATLTYSVGKFGAIIDRAENTLAYHLNTDNIYGNVDISNSGFNNIINKLTLKYDEVEDRDQESQIILETPASLRHENEPILERTARSVFTNNKVEAERLSTIALNKSRRTQVIRVQTDLRALRVQAGDIVSFDYPLYSIDSDTHQYRVLSVEEARVSNNDANGAQYDMPGLELTLLRYFSADYADTEILAFTPAPNTNYPNTRRFPDSDAYGLAGRAFNSDTDTENFASPYVELTWTNPAGFLIEYYTIYESPNSSFNDAVPVGVARPAVGSVYADNASILQHVNNVRVNSPYFFVVPGNSFSTGSPSNGVLVSYNPVLGRDGASIVVVYADSESVEFCNSVTISGSTSTNTRRDNPFDRSIDVNGSYTAQFGDKYLTLNGETATSTYTVQNAGREGYLSFYNSTKDLSIVGVERTDETPVRTALPLHWYIVKGNFATDSDWNLGRTSALSNRNIVTPRLITTASDIPDSDILATAGGGSISCDTEISMMSIFYNQSFSPGQRGWVNFYSYTGTLPTLPIGNTGWVSYSGAAGTSVFLAYAPALNYAYVPPADSEPVLGLNTDGRFLGLSSGFGSSHLIIAPEGAGAGHVATNTMTQSGNTKNEGSTDDSTIKWRSRGPVNLNSNPTQSGFYRPTSTAYASNQLFNNLSTRLTYSPQLTDAQSVSIVSIEATGGFTAISPDPYFVIVTDDGTQSGNVVFRELFSTLNNGFTKTLTELVTLDANESLYFFIEDTDYTPGINSNGYDWGSFNINYAESTDVKLIPRPGTASTTIRDTDNYIGTFRGFNEPNIATAAGLAMYDWAEYTGNEGASIWTVYATDNDGSNPSLSDSDFITTANVTKTRSIPIVLNSTNPTGNTDSETQLFSSLGNLTWDTDDGLCMFNAVSTGNEFVTNRTYSVRGAEAYDSDSVVGVRIDTDTSLFSAAPTQIVVASGGGLTINNAATGVPNLGSGAVMVSASRTYAGTPVQNPDTEVLFTVGGSATEALQFDGSGPGSGPLYAWERSDTQITGGTTNVSESRATAGQWHQWRTSSSGRIYNAGSNSVTITSVRVRWAYRSEFSTPNAARVINSTARVEVRNSSGSSLGLTPTRGFNDTGYDNDTIDITDTTLAPGESIYIVFAVVDRGTHPSTDPAWNNSDDSVRFLLQAGSDSFQVNYYTTQTPMITETGEVTFNAGDAISAGTPPVYTVASSDVISSTFVAGNTYDSDIEVTRGTIQTITRYRGGNNDRLLGTFLGQHATRDGNCWRVADANFSRSALGARSETRTSDNWLLSFNYDSEYDTEETTTLSRDFVCFYSNRGRPDIPGEDLSDCTWSRINISGAETEVEVASNPNNIIDLGVQAVELQDGGVYAVSYVTEDSEAGVALFSTPINLASVSVNAANLDVAVAPLMSHSGTVVGTLLLTYTLNGSTINYTTLYSSDESIRLISLWKRLE